MTIKELYTKLLNAMENGLGEQEVYVLPDGFDEPINIDCANVATEDDANEFEPLAEYANTFIIYV